MNKENYWDNNVEGDAVEGSAVCVSRAVVVQAINETKTGIVPGPSKTRMAPGPSAVSLELIAASRGIGIQVMAEICQSPRWIWNAS